MTDHDRRTTTEQWCSVCVLSRIEATDGHCGLPMPVPPPPECLMLALEREPEEPCDTCDGDGWVNVEPVHTPDGDYYEQGDPCPECSPYQPLTTEDDDD